MTQRKMPRFQIEVLHNRTITETVYKRNPNPTDTESKHYGFSTIGQEVERVVPESYMVYFPSGHSVWFASKAAMAQAGIVPSENFEIDLDTGMPVDPRVVVDLKRHVEKSTHRRAVGA